MPWHTPGHTAVTTILDKQLQTGRLNHAYLFIGSRGIGKQALAEEFATRIVGGQAGGVHPDILLLDRLSSGGIEDIRHALSMISTTPLLGAHRVVIITNVEQMNIASSNALLKTLEEPATRTLFILTANSRQVLATILSRCQVFPLYGLPPQDLRTYAGLQNLDITDDMLTLAHGSIDALLQLVEDKKRYGKLQEQILYLDSVACGLEYEKIVAVQKLAELETEELQNLFTQWLWHLQARLPQVPEVHKTMNTILEGLSRLSQNLNKKLIIQYVLFNA